MITLLAAILLAPAAGALLTGFDRIVTARLQGRVGPPLLQPVYDVLKLFTKGSAVSHPLQVLVVWIHLLSVVGSLVLVALGQDLLLMLFVLALGSIALVIGGFAIRSPYSQLGAQRELLQMLAYEPLLLFLVVGVYLRTGSFMVRDVLTFAQPLVLTMPLFAMCMVMVLGIKMRKSPFDVAASHHAHQELVRGLMTEFSGSTLALIEIAHWYELTLLLALLALLWATPLAAGIAMALLGYAAVVLIGNVCARMTWRWTLRLGWHVGVPASIANLALLYAIR